MRKKSEGRSWTRLSEAGPHGVRCVWKRWRDGERKQERGLTSRTSMVAAGVWGDRINRVDDVADGDDGRCRDCPFKQ